MGISKLISSGDEKLTSGKKVAESCKSAMDEIIHYVEEMCSMIRETSHSTSEQAKGVAEINKAMGQIDAVTAQNTHASKQCSEAAIHLMSEVERTREIINDLLTVINGREGAGERSQASDKNLEIKDVDLVS